jgi:hypothetical protein
MPPRDGPEGRIYEFLTVEKCSLSGIRQPNVPDHIRARQVLVLERVDGLKGVVKCMTVSLHELHLQINFLQTLISVILQITSKAKPKTGSFLPICPNPKEKYPMQIQLDYGCELYNADGSRAPQSVHLPKGSFLRIDEYYEVPLASLRPYLDVDDDQFKIRRKKKGGLGDLKDYLRKMDNKKKALRESLLAQTPGPLVETTLNADVGLHALPEASHHDEPVTVAQYEDARGTLEADGEASYIDANLPIRTSKAVVLDSFHVAVAEPTAVLGDAAEDDEEAWDIVPRFKDASILREFISWVCETSEVDRATLEEKLEEYCLGRLGDNM